MIRKIESVLNSKWLTFANLIILLTIFVQQIRWQNTKDMEIVELQKHANSTIIHMPMNEKIMLFVPRAELDGKLNSIQHSLNDIKSDIRRLK